MSSLKLGSLFDGSGGFPLGALLNGITPVWASEIEPFPIRVTTKRIPQMKHYGDICKINGGEIEPVDIVSFGSPCTDLSLAGKRTGIGGSKSSLFFEAIRVIKEMRCKTNGRYPRFIIWENVFGAFSSGKARDYKTVLEEIVHIKDETISVPMPPKDKWLAAGEIVGDGFSVAFRTLDAQFWGVPQRRRRIYLVADFGGGCAGEILFEPEGVPWNPPQSTGKGQGASANVKGGVGAAVSFEPGAMSRLGGHYATEQTCTLRAQMGDNRVCVALENHPADSRISIDETGNFQTLTSRMGTGGGNTPMLFQTDSKAYGICSDGSNAMRSSNRYSGIYEAETSRTLDANGGSPACNQGGLAIVESYSLQGSMIGRKDKNGPRGSGINKDISFTIDTASNHAVVYALDRASFNQGEGALYDFKISDDGVNSTLVGQGPSAVADFTRLGSDADVTGPIQASCHDKQFLGNQEAFSRDYHIVSPEYTVRRLTPTECASLQGFEKNWCSDLVTENPTEEDIAFWAEVFETHRHATGIGKKPKSRNQIIKWLKNPHSDSAEYKLWGNGVCAQCVCFVMAGIARVMRNS